jgi:cytoplasmic iron level regulating protein YaaA (DUF328/UPF0246 family)
MLLILSPAKTLDFDSTQFPASPPSTRPEFAAEAARLVKRLRLLDAAELGALMHVSAELAELNVARFRDWRPRAAALRERLALQAFRGDVYIGLRAEDFSTEDLAFAQDHLRILSGLYGVLRPLDRMQPYRLEMGTALATERGVGLYAFWGERIARALKRQAAAVGADTLVNLASQEYFRAVDARALGLRVVTPLFKERRGGQLKIISFSAKRARGAMAGFALRNRLREPEALRGFNEDGYTHDPSLSSADEWVFVR